MESRLKEILQEKGSTLFATVPQATVAQAVAEMNTRGVGALLVLEAGKPVGIFTERDILRRVVAAGKDPNTTSVASVMTKDLICVSPELTLAQAMSIITQRRIRHLPVMHRGDLLGMLSIGDLTKWSVRDRDVEITQLTNYIEGRYPA